MNVEISTFSNGLTVITDPMANLESAALGVWVGTGSRNERPDQMGLSHMLEHMAFKGTATRSARQIAEEIEAVGGYLNAYTSREQTAFHARVLKADVPLGLDIIADILINPAYEASELERERQVVLQELGQARDTPDDIVFDYLQSVIYPGQPLGWAILGDADTVGSFTPANLREYAGARYRSKNMLLVSSGAVDHAQMVGMAQEKFSRLATGSASSTAPAHYVGGDFRQEDDLEQAHIVYAFPGLAANDPDFYVAQLYATVLGGGMSSRLFQEVREKRGLCYSIYAFANNFQDDGFTGIYVGTGEKEAGEISAVIAGEMEAMTGAIGEAEIARARAQLKSGLLMGLERPGSRAEQIASQMFSLGRIQPVAEIVAQLDAVDAAAVKRFADRTMRLPSIAALGPVAKLESHAKFAARFSGEPKTHAAEIAQPPPGNKKDFAAMMKTRPMAFMRGLTFPGGQQPVIRGAGVYLRYPRIADYVNWARLRGESREFLSKWEPVWSDDELTRGAFRRRIKRYHKETRLDSAYVFFVFRESDDTLMGGCTLSNVRRGVTQCCALGYWIGARFARQGMMSDAVRALIPFVFTTLGLHRIEAACLPENEPSRNLLSKLGFRVEGEAKRYLLINGEWKDHILFALLEDEASLEGGARLG